MDGDVLYPAGMFGRPPAAGSENIPLQDRDMQPGELIRAAPERFAAADISDFPWTEIDVSDDVAGARETVLPQLDPIQ